MKKKKINKRARHGWGLILAPWLVIVVLLIVYAISAAVIVSMTGSAFLESPQTVLISNVLRFVIGALGALSIAFIPIGLALGAYFLSTDSKAK
ncbi:MAG TPA: hypothetical protein QF873_02345 [Patescibacteria group bacterium]|nr:hypothetical protein [Patescibacteria group bacterium]